MILFLLALNVRIEIKFKVFKNDHDKFKFWNGLLYYVRHLYVLYGLVWLQVLQDKHDMLDVGHFGFNKTMELTSWDY